MGRQHRSPQLGHRERIVLGQVQVEIAGRDGVPRDDAARLVDQKRIPGVNHRLPAEERAESLGGPGVAELGETPEPLLL